SLGAIFAQPGLSILLLDTFLMWAGFFMLVPLISIHYVDGLGWSAGLVGVALAVRQLAQQGLAPFGGLLADRHGAKPLLIAGMAVRAAGFGLLAFADSFPILLAGVTIAALGGALFEAPQAGAIAVLSSPETRSQYFAISSTVSALGTAVGTQIGVLLLGWSFALVAVVAAAVFCTALVVTLLLLPSVKISTGTRGRGNGLMLALRDRRMMRFSLVLIGFWFIWVQFSISVPLRVLDVADEDLLRWVFLVNTGMTIVLGYPVVRYAGKVASDRSILIAGIAIGAGGYGLLALAEGTASMLLCVAVIAFGMLMAFPTQRTIATEMADPVARGSYLGVNGLSLAVGGSLGNVLGGTLYDLGQNHGAPALPWLTFALIGLSTAALLLQALPGHGYRSREQDADGA
ncbi:MAG: MFS transporter, partial [Chloroflexota bacterium]|nr:MFS transporter [Chloroflexota bacterium]